MSGIEIVGLVLGVAGLYGSCVEAVRRVQSYKSSNTASHTLDARFQAERLRLEIWGERVGLQHIAAGGSNASLGQPERHVHKSLQNTKVLEAVEDLLSVIEHVCLLHEGLPSLKKPARTNSGLTESDPQGLRDGLASRKSRRQKLAWAFGGKEERTDQIKLLCDLVQQLHNLVPIDGQGSNDSRIDGVSQDTAWGSGMSEEVLAILANINNATQAATRRDINSWLLGQPLSNEIFESAVQRRLSGTCDWILERPAYLDWVSSVMNPTGSASRVLWIHGPAGFGKTVLSSRIIEHLSSELSSHVGHFFFSTDFQSRSDPFTAFRSWITQLISLDRNAFDYAKRAWEAEQDLQASRGTISRLLKDVLQKMPGTVLVLDGLDECIAAAGASSVISEFLDELHDALDPCSKIRLLIVSRDAAEIRQSLMRPDDRVTEYRICPDDVRSDTEEYSKSIVNGKLPNKSAEIRQDVSQRMADRCEGQFLWLKMHQESLSRGLNKRQLLKAIEETPKEIDSIYDRNWNILMELPGHDSSRALSLLRLAAFSLRPLTVGEMTEAVLMEAIEPDDDLDDFPVDELPDGIDDDYIDSRICELCSPLLEVRKHENDSTTAERTIHLTHFSVKEYLLRRLPSPWSPSPLNLRPLANEQLQNSMVGKLCLTYLKFSSVWGDLPIVVEDIQFKGYFRDYAASRWYEHIKLGPSSTQAEIANDVLSFFDSSNKTLSSWRSWFEQEHQESEEEPVVGDVSPEPLYYAIKLGLQGVALQIFRETVWTEDLRNTLGKAALDAACEGTDIAMVKALLQEGCSPEVKGQNEQTSLHVACRHGRVEAVKLLLAHGAKYDTRGKRGGDPLLAACLKSHREIAELLLREGANPNSRSDREFVPLNGACREGDVKTVQLLLDYGADLAYANAGAEPLLYSASAGGHTDLIKMLLDLGSEVDLQTPAGFTSLQLACSRGHTSAARMLLDYGANVNARHEEMQSTPLLVASFNGHIDVVKLLFDRRVDVTMSTSKNQGTAVNVAALSGHTELVELLLQKGVSFTTPNEDGMTPLYQAALRGHLEIVRLFHRWGADISTPKLLGWTPVNAAAEQNHIDVLEYLYEHGADISRANDEGGTPLHSAAQWRHLEMARCLLQKGADTDRTNFKGGTPLNIAAEQGDLLMVEMLLDHGADIHKANTLGQAPIYCASDNGWLDVVKLLIDRGADVNSTINFGATPINIATAMGHFSIVQTLLNHGADFEKANSRGIAPMYAAATYGRPEIARFLLGKGANIENAENQGWTPLYGAVEEGDKEMCRLLLDRGANVEATGNNGLTPLLRAVDKGDTELCRLLLNRGADLSKPDEYTAEPVYGASYSGRSDIVDLLLDRGADIEARNPTGWRPVMAAADQGHVDLVRNLLDRGADVQAKKDGGWDALHLAVRGNHRDIAQLLLDRGADIDAKTTTGWSPLMVASDSGYVELVRMFLDRGASVHATNNAGWAAIHMAVRSDHHDIAELLLDRGADFFSNFSTLGLGTPNLRSTQGKKIEVLKRCINQARLSDLRGLRELDPLGVAAVSGNTELVQLVLDRAFTAGQGEHSPPSPHPVNDHAVNLSTNMCSLAVDAAEGRAQADVSTAISPNLNHMAACSLASGDTAKSPPEDTCKHTPRQVLRTSNDESSPKNESYNRTPLFLAARYGHENVVELLLNCPINAATVDVVDWKGMTPLLAAVRNGHLAVAKKLLPVTVAEAFCSIDAFGKTLLWWAIRCGNDAMPDLVKHAASERAIVLRSEDPAPDPVAVKNPSHELSGWCDACTLSIEKGSVVYKCNDCQGGLLCICRDCFESGTRCFGNHDLERRETEQVDYPGEESKEDAEEVADERAEGGAKEEANTCTELEEEEPVVEAQS